MASIAVTAVQGDSLDLICWRELGTTAVLEAALALNPGLADAGVIIPAGTAVNLPALSAATPLIRETVNLWD